MDSTTRFWKKVAKIDDAGSCWLWIGAGVCYGNFYWDKGTPDIGAHVASYLLFRGSVPEGADVCHTCDVPKCVRPSHLFLGDAQMNVDDMVRKSRESFRFEDQPFIGSKHPEAKLTEETVRVIKRLLPLHKDAALAKRYEVSPACIWLIRNGKSWKHVEI